MSGEDLSEKIVSTEESKIMETKEKRAKYKEEVRQEILDAARELFVNEGYEKFSTRKLAEKTNYSPKTLYHYFKNEDDLLFAMCEEVAERFFADLIHIRTAHPDPLESLRHALLNLINVGFKNPDEYKFLFITRPQAYGTLEEFMEKESMARNSYVAFREIVMNCIVTRKLQEIDIDVLTQVLTVATLGLATLTVNKTSFPWVDRNVLAHTLVEGLLRGLRR
jgi:AcrR family transcriptional regulator